MPVRRLLVASLLALLILHSPLYSQAPECVAVQGALLAKKGEASWDSVKAGSKAPFDRLLVSLFESDLKSANGAVEVRLRGEIGERGPLAAFESAVIFHENPKVDVDLTLERGIVVFTNKKKEGAAHVDVRIRGKTLNISLLEPETKLGIDLYARHAPGINSLKDDDPTTFVFMLNAVGSVEIHSGEKQVSMKAPPGPAMLRWDSALRQVDVQHIDRLPEWVIPTAEEKKTYERINQAAAPLAGPDAAATFLKLLFSDDPLERKVGMTAVGALGSPAPLFVALQQSKNADTRQFAILVLRNWLGQGTGQIKKLESGLQGIGVSKSNAESLVHLLIGFDEEERQEPGTYQMLIEGLNHKKLLVRELAYWHLLRLAPAGRTIAYDPAGSDEQLAEGVRRWRELIPSGKLPPAEKK